MPGRATGDCDEKVGKVLLLQERCGTIGGRWPAGLLDGTDMIWDLTEDMAAEQKACGTCS